MRFRDCFTIDSRRPPGEAARFWPIAQKIATAPGFRVVVYYRIATYLRQRRFLGPLMRLIGRLILIRLARVPGVELNTMHEIGEGFVLGHPHDIVIGYGSKIHKRVTIYNGVTLGARTAEELGDGRDPALCYPTIEDDVIIYTGAKILGPISIGKGSVVGANAVVLKSFGAGSVIVGLPGRDVSKRSQATKERAPAGTAKDSD